MTPTLATRDRIVIGCSAGGVEALPRILQQLPPALPASICIVQHLSPSSPRLLVDILGRSTQLPVHWAEQGARLVAGHVYVAPPDVHLLLTDDHLRLAEGARENRARPSIDKLFRSAALEGGRVIGVLLTGLLDDGVAGLVAIHAAGGVTIVQHPDDAAFPDLPSHALEALDPDRILRLAAIPNALVELAGRRVADRAVPELIACEAGLEGTDLAEVEQLAALGPQTPIACPECKGPTWQVGEPPWHHFRCYLGHAVSARAMVTASEHEVETALWSAVRALNDRAVTLETLASDEEQRNRSYTSGTYRARACEARKQAELVRQFMLELIRNLHR